MNIYEDYSRYISDNHKFIELIKNNVPSVYVLIEDVIVVLDFIVKQHEQYNKVEEDLADFFEPGYRYIISLITEMTIMYQEYFKSDIELFSKYSSLIVYFFYIDDLKGHLYSFDKLTDDNKKIIDKVQEEIETVLVNNLEPDQNKLIEYEVIIDQLDTDKSYHPVYSIFTMVREELHLY